MSKKPIYIALFTGLSIAFLNWLCGKDEKKQETIEVKIDQDDKGTWRIFDDFGRNRGTLELQYDDTVKWFTGKSDVIFTFPVEVHRYFIFDEGLFEDGHEQLLKEGKKLSLTVKDGAPTGKIIYKIYVTEAGEYVQGNSPIKIIIRK